MRNSLRAARRRLRRGVMIVGMISTELAVALRDAGLVWHPRSGDRFQLDEPEFEADVFTVSEMTIEPRDYPTGQDPRVQRHDGVGAGLGRARGRAVAAARGSAARAAARRVPGAAAPEPTRTRSRSCVRRRGQLLVFQHPEPADAYALAVLELLRRIA